PTLKRLLLKEIDTAFVGLDGRYYGRLSGHGTPHVALRRAQYTCQGDAAFTLALAQNLVRGKLHNQRAWLQQRARDAQSGSEMQLELRGAIDDLDAYHASAGRKQTLNALRGVEGSATARYFSALRVILKPPWRWRGRNRRPPRDPVNVLLSLGYTLMTQSAVSAAELVGLDPYVGFLHSDAYNRPSLALDLVEEFRSVVDGLVIHACHHQLVKPGDFREGDRDAGERPVELDREAARRFIQAFEKRMRRINVHPRTRERMPFWRFVELQAREMARCLRERQPDYRAIRFR
ncbi:MAG: CRISPR-associated endonuclease Cas1, partial [Anaerolineae bacterium]|nr:CRISPR-associated endonuclease Cas1 [Anaerolineae bacterium]